MEETAKLDEIKEVEGVGTKVYEIPMTAIANKADGTGTVEISVAPIKVTKAQLAQGIKNANAQIVSQQAQVAKLQARLDAITELEAKV